MQMTLKAWRQVKGLTQQEMADKLKICRASYNEWESHPENLTIKKAMKASEVLGVSFNDIIFLST